MNYFAVLMGAFIAFQANSFSPIKVDNNEWLEYKQQHGKSYDDQHLDSLKKTIYQFNKQRVEQFHREQPEAEHFQLDLNHMADMSEPEMMQINGYRKSQPEHLLGANVRRNSPEEQKFLDDILASAGDVPAEMDWRKVANRVSEVKNQGQCGSCWAFSAVGALEGQEKSRAAFLSANETDQIVELSEQNLVDCVKDDAGCNGGSMDDAFRFINSEGGIDDELSYPYEGRTRKCRFQKSKVAFKDTGAAVLPIGDEEKLKAVVAKFGPVSVAIDASSFWFQLYRKGVYINKHCKSGENQLDHGVLVVGYGTDAKKGDYWIVKNSWGPKWGESGYIRMARNRKNMCGIATAATIPTF